MKNRIEDLKIIMGKERLEEKGKTYAIINNLSYYLPQIEQLKDEIESKNKIIEVLDKKNIRLFIAVNGGKNERDRI